MLDRESNATNAIKPLTSVRKVVSVPPAESLRQQASFTPHPPLALPKFRCPENNTQKLPDFATTPIPQRILYCVPGILGLPGRRRNRAVGLSGKPPALRRRSAVRQLSRFPANVKLETMRP